MKVRIHRWLGLAIVPLTLLLLGAPSAFAAGETHKCDGDPNFPTLNEVFTRTESNPENGPIIVRRTDGFDCVISATDIHAIGQIDIRVEGGGKLIIPNAANIRSLGSNITLISTGNDISAPNSDVKSDNLIDIQAGVSDGTVAGSIDTKDIISNYRNVQVGDANILIRAQGALSIGKVKTTGDLGINSQRSGNVQIDANLHPMTAGTLTIGGTGSSIEEVDIRSLTGGTDPNGNPSPRKVEIGVRIKNGVQNSTGPIIVSDPSAVKVKQSQSRSGRIELNANKGDLIFSGGALDASNSNGFGGGNIYLFAEKIDFNGNILVTNEQNKTAPNTARQIIFAASTIDFKDAAELKIFSNGKGLSNAEPATVYFLPQGGIISNSEDNVVNLNWTLDFNGSFFFLDKPLHFDGGTTADLIVEADGEHVQMAVTGHPIIFDGKDVTFQTKGDHNIGKHEIVMGYFGNATGVDGIAINNSGKTEFFVRGEGNNAAGGDIQIQTPDRVVVRAANFNLKANGPKAKPGDGGTIFFTTSSFEMEGIDTKVKFIADASADGSGNAQILRNNRRAIFFQQFGTNTIPVGIAKKQVNFSAQGGGDGGNGGAIDIVSGGTVRVRNKPQVVNAAAFNLDGNGGIISINAAQTVFVQNSNDNTEPVAVALDASGGLNTGMGGTIIVPNAKAKGGSFPQMINVDALMDVNGGETESELTFFGSITLNGVECSQTKHQQAWPKTTWQCGTSASGSNIFDAANSLPSNLKSYLANTLSPSNPEVQLFNMPNSNDFEAFFSTSLVNDLNSPNFGQLGFTVANIRLTVIYDQVKDSNGALSSVDTLIGYEPTVREANTIHELGHQLDYIWGSPSNLGGFNATLQGSALYNDLADLDTNFDCPDLFLQNTCLTYLAQEPGPILLNEYSFASPEEAFTKVFLYNVQLPTVNYKDATDVFAANPHLSRVNSLMQSLISSPPQAQK